MPATVPNRRGRRPDPRRREALLDAARQVFDEKGFAGASTREIAQRAGILSGSLYHHVDSKEELLFAIVQDVYERSVAAAELALARDGDPVAGLELLMRSHVANVIADVVTTSLALSEYKSLSPEHAAEIDRQHRDYLAAFSALITRGQEQGSIDASLDVGLTTAAIVGCLNSVVRWYRPDSPLAPEQITDSYVRLLMSGLINQAQ
jgi:AcrR family transcriptional regulator